ncbi:MAG: hypothetical protein ACJAVK_001232 [Akkermansiaceae bacterium]|jgi:hypothetical protein
MYSLDTTLPEFWNNLSFLSSCELRLETPTCMTSATIDLSSAHLTDGTFTIPGASLALATASFSEVYSSFDPLKVTLISHSRELKLSLRPTDDQALPQLHTLCDAYASEAASQNFKVPEVVKPGLCPCCVTAARIRVRQITRNPLTTILADAASRSKALLVSVQSNDGCFTSAHLPAHLLQNDSCLISEGFDSRFEINIRHLHAMKLTTEVIDGKPHRSLELMNSLGDTTNKVSAPADEVREAWVQILGRRDHCYEIF